MMYIHSLAVMSHRNRRTFLVFLSTDFDLSFLSERRDIVVACADKANLVFMRFSIETEDTATGVVVAKFNR